MRFRVSLLLLAFLCLSVITAADVVMVLREGEAPGDTTAPTVVSVAVNGFTWTVTYDENVFGQSGFSGNGSTTGAKELTGSGGNGTTVHTFTADETAVFGETLTYDYTAGTVTDAASNALAAIDDGEVTNNTPTPGDVVAPTLDDEVIDTDGVEYTFTFSEAVFGTGGFTFNGAIQGAGSLTYVSGSGTDTHVYTGSPAVTASEAVTVSYTQGTLQDAAGNLLANISGRSATNNSEVAAGTAPILEHPEVIWVQNGGAINFTPTVLQGESITWTVSNLPTGASINSGTGAITGTLSTPGKWVSHITATNSGGDFTIHATIHVFASAITIDGTFVEEERQAWGGLVLDTANCKYTLADDFTSDGTAFHVTAANVGLDIAGCAVIYDNLVDSDIVIANGDFETGDATGWDLSGASGGASVGARTYLSGQCVEEDNGYGLAVTVPAGQTYTVETTADVTVESGDTYAFCALILGKNPDGQGGSNPDIRTGPGDSAYDFEILMRLKGTSDEVITGNGRAGAVHVDSFTASGNTTAPVEISFANTGSVTRVIYVDRVTLERYGRHGLALAAGDNGQWGDVVNTGNADSFTCDLGGGSITQGAAGSPDSTPVCARSIDDITVSGGTLECRGLAGTFGYPVNLQSGHRKHIQNVTINNNGRFINSRDAKHGTSIYQASPGVVWIINNTLNGGPYDGILHQPHSAGPSDIAYNKIYLTGRYTNAFGIEITGGENPTGQPHRVHHNIIDSGLTAANGARGIKCTGADWEIDYNTIYAAETPLNQEYGGYVIGGAYGIQFEGVVQNIDMHDNGVTVINRGGAGGAPLRPSVSNGSTNINIYDNVFTLESDGTEIPAGTSSQNAASAFFIDGNSVASNPVTDLSGVLLIRDNTFRTAERFITARDVANLKMLRCSWEKIPGGSSNSANFMEYGSDGVLDMIFTDQTYLDTDAQTAFEAMVWNHSSSVNDHNETGTPTTNDLVELNWTITIHVTDTGVDQPEEEVEVYLANTETLVANGSTDQDGEVTFTLDEFRYASGSTAQVQYDIRVGSVEREADYTPTESETLGIAL